VCYVTPFVRCIAPRTRGAITSAGDELAHNNILSLKSLLAFDQGDFDLLAVFQCPVELTSNRGEVRKHVGSVLRRDESEASGVVESLHGASFTFCHSLPPLLLDGFFRQSD